MMRTNLKIERTRQSGGRGQSLVEFALTLPILIVLIVGVSEVGWLFVQKIRAVHISRETTRFLAKGGSDEHALSISQQTNSHAFGGQGLIFDEDRMSVYVSHATINDGGTAIDEADWEEAHIYPTQQYFDDQGIPDPEPTSGLTRDQLYADLSQDGALAPADLAELGVVGSVVHYEATHIIPLPIFPQTLGGIHVSGHTVMRLEATLSEAAGTPAQGCSAYALIFYENAVANNGSGRTLANAQPGDQFEIGLGVGSDNRYNTLEWNGFVPGNEVEQLGRSLGWEQISIGEPPQTNSKDDTYGYINPYDANDRALHLGDWVMRGPVSIAVGTDAGQAIADHRDTGRAIRVLLYDLDDTINAVDNQAGPSASVIYHISRFTIIEIVAFDGSNMTIEFVRHDSSCGNP
jgi:hypothetical protein